MPAVGLLILAAGASSRMARGLPKQLLLYQNRSLLRHAAETALASRCRPVIVVLGARAERLRQELHDLPVTVAVADRWEQGMGASLHAGMAALTTHSLPLDGVVIALGDQPLLSAAHLDALVAASAAFPGRVIASEYGGTLGVPALFPSPLFTDLQTLPEAQGAKPLIGRHASQAVRIPFPEGALDIDTAEDYQKLLSEARGNTGSVEVEGRHEAGRE